MSIWVVILSLFGIVSLLVVGFALGARKGKNAREEMLFDLEKSKHSLDELYSTANAQIELLDREIRQLRLAARKDLHRVLNAVEGHEKLEELLVPIAVREKLGSELSDLKFSVEDGLSALLVETEKVAGLERLILTDESGLLLTASGGDISKLEAIAGSSSLLFVLADRFKRVGLFDPESFVAYEGNTATLFRIFTVDKSRYMLSVISTNKLISPAMFDLLVHNMQRLLSRSGSHFTQAITTIISTD